MEYSFSAHRGPKENAIARGRGVRIVGTFPKLLPFYSLARDTLVNVLLLGAVLPRLVHSDIVHY